MLTSYGISLELLLMVVFVENIYTDDLFIDALVKAHADVASDSQRVISIMIDTETELHKKNKDSEAS